MLKHHTILYDAECPLCHLYTKAFVSSGMLDAGGRAPYQDMSHRMCTLVDRKRAVNEIALVNQETGEVRYGIHSLLAVIGHSFPLFRPLFGWRPFIWLMSKLYAFVSYNRKVIIPSAVKSSDEMQPSFHLGYRIAYLVFTWLITSFLLTRYAWLLKDVLPVGNSYREYLVCGGQVLFQGIVVSLYARKQGWNYLGNMMTISLAGALLLSIGLLLSVFTDLSSIVYAGYFLFVAGLMLLEHIRRTKLMKLSVLLTLSWIGYRFIILFILLILH